MCCAQILIFFLSLLKFCLQIPFALIICFLLKPVQSQPAGGPGAEPCSPGDGTNPAAFSQPVPGRDRKTFCQR